MKFIFLAEDELRVREGRATKDDVLLSIYSKDKLLEYIQEYSPIKHPLPIYRFLRQDGVVFETLNLQELAQLLKLDYKGLSYLNNHPSKSYKGFIKAPEETSTIEHNITLYDKHINDSKKSKNIYSKFSLKNDFIVKGY